MRILRIIHSLNPKDGGPVEASLQSSRALERKGHYIEFASFDPSDSPFLHNRGFTMTGLGSCFPRYGLNFRYINWLKIKSQDFDCVLVQGIWQFLSFGTYLALRKHKTPYFVFSHGMLDPWFHIGHPFKYLKKRIYWALAERRALLGAQRVLFTTKEEQKLALTSMPSSNYMSEVVPYGIRPPKKMSFNKEDFYSLFPSAQGKKILLFMSRLHPKKGCDLLLKAFSKMRNTENVFLIMAGPDQVAWKKELLLLAERLRINDSVAWPGMLEGELKELTLHFADAFILPSHQENFGISVAEALAREIPVLISTKVNIWREVVESDAGWAAEDTEEGCLHLLNLWVEEENIHKKRLSAKLCFDKNFNLDLNAHKLEETLTLRSV